MKKNFKTGLIVLIVIIVVILFVSIGSLFQRRSFSTPEVSIQTYSSNPSVKVSSSSKKQYIAALYIEGTIEEANNSYNQKWLLETISNLKNDSKNQGLAIYVNSPGGAVYQADEIYLALQDYKTSGKQIYVYQGPMAASGGYYISCAANKIYANRNTLTGCIGVICGQSFDLTGLFENLGIKSETIHSGKNKNMMNYNEPFTDEQREIMQSISNECYEQFVSIVVSQRHISFDEAYKVSDGRLYTANQALNNNLIDKIDSWDGMITDFSSEIEKKGIDVKTFKYQKKQTMMEMILSKVEDIKKTENATQLGLPTKVLNDINNFNSYPAYIYRP